MLAPEMLAARMECNQADVMTNRRRSAAARLVPTQTPERLFELVQEHIRPLIAMIDRLNEAGAEDELRVISKQLTRLVYRAQLRK